jgi:hypothetical protein
VVDTSISEPHKRCTKCKKEFPATLDYFGSRKDRPTGQSLTSWCRQCLRCASSAYALTHREAITQTHAVWVEAHAQERALYYKQYGIDHAEAISQRRKKKYAENAEEERAKARTRRAQNPEYGRTYRRDYRKRKPQVHVVGHSVRRARKLSLPDTLTPQQWQAALQYWHYACAVCGHEEGFYWTLSADHWIPMTDPACPGTTAENIIPLCHTKKGSQNSCNTTKHNRDPKEWLIDRLGPRAARKKLKEIYAYFASLNVSPWE